MVKSIIQLNKGAKINETISLAVSDKKIILNESINHAVTNINISKIYNKRLLSINLTNNLAVAANNIKNIKNSFEFLQL